MVLPIKSLVRMWYNVRWPDKKAVEKITRLQEHQIDIKEIPLLQLYRAIE